MNGLRLTAFVLALAFPLFAQVDKLSERQLGAYKGNDEAVRSVTNYCDAVDDYGQEHQPHIFAKVDSSRESESHGWSEFAGRDDWYASGKPVPVAFVWDKGGAIVRVTIVASRPRVSGPAVARRRVDYCYGVDTKPIRIRAIWYVPTTCEVLFPCLLISGREFVLGGQRPGVTDWVLKADGTIQKLWNGKEVNDYFDPSNSLTARELHLRSNAELPFNQLTPK